MVGSEEDLITKDDGAISWVSRVAVPFAPPASTCITGGMIIRVAAIKINRIDTMVAAVGGCR